MHFIDDDGLHARQGRARSRGQQKEERLRGRDENVGAVLGKGPTFGGGGVAGADRDGQVVHRVTQAMGCVSDADQRGAEVALDVNSQGLEG